MSTSRRVGSLARSITTSALAASLGALISTPALAETSFLYPESSYTKERCLGPCACVLGPLEGRLFGQYDITLVSIGDVFDFYSIDNVRFFALTPEGTKTLVGSGTYQRSDVAGEQVMHLTLFADNGSSPITLDSGLIPLTYSFPVMNISFTSAVIACDRYSLHLVSGPASPCPADLDNGGGAGILDNAVDVTDLLYFLTKYEAGDPAADQVGGPCACPDCVCPDGAVDIQDLLFFLRHFEAGC